MRNNKSVEQASLNKPPVRAERGETSAWAFSTSRWRSRTRALASAAVTVAVDEADELVQLLQLLPASLVILRLALSRERLSRVMDSEPTTGGRLLPGFLTRLNKSAGFGAMGVREEDGRAGIERR